MRIRQIIILLTILFLPASSLVQAQDMNEDEKAKIIEEVNIKKDIQKFIDLNKTNHIPPIKFEYVPYISKL